MAEARQHFGDVVSPTVEPTQSSSPVNMSAVEKFITMTEEAIALDVLPPSSLDAEEVITDEAKAQTSKDELSPDSSSPESSPRGTRLAGSGSRASEGGSPKSNQPPPLPQTIEAGSPVGSPPDSSLPELSPRGTGLADSESRASEDEGRSQESDSPRPLLQTIETASSPVGSPEPSPLVSSPSKSRSPKKREYNLGKITSYIKTVDQTVLGISSGLTANKLGLLTFQPVGLHCTPTPGAIVPPWMIELLPILAITHGVTSIISGSALVIENANRNENTSTLYSKKEKIAIGALQAISGSILTGTGSYALLLDNAAVTSFPFYLIYGINACVEFGAALSYFVKIQMRYPDLRQLKEKALIDLAAKTCALVGWGLLLTFNPVGWTCLAGMAIINIFAPKGGLPGLFNSNPLPESKTYVQRSRQNTFRY